MIYQEEKTSTESDWPGARLGTLLFCWARMFTCGMCFFFITQLCGADDRTATNPPVYPLCQFSPGRIFSQTRCCGACCMLLLLSFILRSCCWTAVENLQSFQSFCLYWKKINIISWEFHQYFYMIWLKLSSFKTACLSKQKINLQIIMFNGLL